MISDYIIDILNDAIAGVIVEWQENGLTDEEIKNKISQIDFNEFLSKSIENAPQFSLCFFKKHMYEIALEEQAKTNEFLSHQDQKWGKCFAASQTMYVLAVESAELYSEYVQENVDDFVREPKKYTYLTLQHMHGRVCQEFLEILHLMRLGFADCAYARWRSMYELCCCGSFILKYGEKIAKQYFEQSDTEEHKYMWTKGAKDDNGNLVKAITFKDIQKYCDVNPVWEKQYKLACFVNHASPQGTFKRLANGSTENIIPVGHSDWGITTPAEHSSIALAWMTNMFISIFPNEDGALRIQVLNDWIEVIRELYFSTHEEIFGEGSIC